MVICYLILSHQSGHSPLRLRLFVPPASFSTFNFELLTSSSPTFQWAARLRRPGRGVSALGSSSLGLTFSFQLSTFNCVFFSSPHLCALCVLCGENSSFFAPHRSSKSFTIRTSKTPLPQLLYNPHLQTPLGSAGNKGLITPLESALTKNSPATPLESALTKTGGVGSFREFILDHPSSRVPEIRPGFEGREGLQNFGGSRALEHRIILANSPVSEDQHTLRVLRDVVFVRDQHDCQSFVVLSRTGKVRKLVTNRDSHLLRRCRVMRRQGKRDGEVNSPLQNGRRAVLKDRVYTEGTKGDGNARERRMGDDQDSSVRRACISERACSLPFLTAATMPFASTRFASSMRCSRTRSWPYMR